MTRKNSLFVAAIAAFGISFTPVPAAADSSDVAKVLGGLAVLGIIAKVADDRRDRRKQQAVTQSQRDRQITGVHRGDDFFEGELRRPGEVRSDRRRGFKNKPLPERCQRIAATARGDRLVYTQRCLNRHYKFASRLPEFCERRIGTNRGVRRVFGARCLRRDGWNVARR